MFPLLHFCISDHMYFVEIELVFLIPLFIPGIDENTTTGYIVVLIYHISLFVLSVIGIIAIGNAITHILSDHIIFGQSGTLPGTFGSPSGTYSILFQNLNKH